MDLIKKTAASLLAVFIVIISLAGCSLGDKIEKYSANKEHCFLNTENVTQFSYMGADYTILDDTVPNGGLGEWIGYIRRLAAVDETGKILFQDSMQTAAFQTPADHAAIAQKTAYIIPFLNVYAAPNTDDYLIVDVNGGYHKAIRSEKVKDTDPVFDFKSAPSVTGKFEIDPENATRLICGGAVYQVTSEPVSADKLGSYIDIIAKSVTFDTETKRPLSKNHLNKLDLTGKSAGQGREMWFYAVVYEIYGTDKKEAVAVKINNCCYIAKQQ